MSEQQQATNDQAAWEAKYKELQAEFTRKSQQLAEIERMRDAGQLVDKAHYDDHLIKWASENPEQALEVFPSLRQYAAQQGTDANGSKAQFGNVASMNAFDDSIFDTNSEAYQKFVAEHGQRGYRQALYSKMAPELTQALGLDKELNELREFKKVHEGSLEDLRERIDRAEKYAISSFDQVQLSQDPRRKTIRDMQERLKETKGEAWYEIVDKLKKLEEYESKQTAAPPPQPPATPNLQPTAPSPQQLADRIDQTSVVPQGAGSGSSPLPSQAMDSFDAALAKVDPALAQRLGLVTAA